MWLQIEPYGLGCEMPPGQEFHVHVAPDKEYPAQVEVTDEMVLVFSGDAIYQNGVEVLDFIPEPENQQ